MGWAQGEASKHGSYVGWAWWAECLHKLAMAKAIEVLADSTLEPSSVFEFPPISMFSSLKRPVPLGSLSKM